MSFQFANEESNMDKGDPSHTPDRAFGNKPADKGRQCNPSKHTSTVFNDNRKDAWDEKNTNGRDKNESNFSGGFVVGGDWKNSRRPVNGTHTTSSVSL